MPIYKTLSIKQPWAHLILARRKTLEMRTWCTAYRGELLITASSQPKNFQLDGMRLPSGVAICLVDLVDIREFGIDDLAEAGYEGDALRRARNRWLAGLDMNLGDATVYGWRLANPRPVRPAAVKGKLHIFEVDIGGLE